MDFLQSLTTIASITPNRPWGLDVPNYFWFTGSSAAAFIISSFAHVFGMRKYKPIAGFSLLLAFVLLAAAPFNLIDDLRQPGRILNFFAYGWENFLTSPMKWGVLLLLAYPLLILFEALVLYRPFFVRQAESARSAFAGRWFRMMALGNMRTDEASLARDERRGLILGIIGIPLALSVHGYTGYILGVVHANPLWSTPLMPILFLASAMVSGTGLLIILLPLVQKFFTPMGRVDGDMMRELARLLGWFIIIDLVIRFFWLTFAMPFAGEERFVLQAFFQHHFFDVVYIEYLLCLFVPLAIAFSPLARRTGWVFAAGLIAAVGVWLFRWNTVIGGQTIGRTATGFLEYSPHWFGQGSITAVMANWGVFIALLALVMVLFPWDKEMAVHYKGGSHGEK
ncbi:Polysulphide reductase NrfD [Desulfurispirillum indicum S5]|uniref:Polysulphide reductase NrfD n=1 Tax=Desulfurispirillum indicum (strain ATCC BAA-1389 / DSM 22839 / S5) TaxID=653733 RepID=E6W5S2_DESIS|nr:NrfD/PsrC family molybdoenzyme membrane anchor subunit [Desulfurispirillum indicum]ADU67207.1 Polysulphide reductase NrfD [Desulfurispirillum indicum S5]